MKQIFLLLAVTIGVVACHRPMHVAQVNSELIMVDSTLEAIQDTTYLQHLAPIKEDLERQLNVAIGYAPEMMTVRQPECNMLNWASDALFAMAQKRYPSQVDMAVVNIGGMRCEWAVGDITRRHIFELMPFDNELVVLTMKGESILQLCQACINRGGEGVAGLRIKARDGKLLSATINGKAVVPSAYYIVATSDYLSQGNDGLTPLRQHEELWRSEEKIRDLYIEYVQEVKTVQAKVDGRMDIK
ncbi:MAG: 5'-nucleotidase C-terminal domain-containing protein [Paludibacteraceae bacterium]|nr:5'-nucleotidase C-terminal domain-containing protein [Paludibacteraceae bacterium]